MARKIREGRCDLWWPEQAGAHGCLPVLTALGALALGLALLARLL